MLPTQPWLFALLLWRTALRPALPEAQAHSVSDSWGLAYSYNQSKQRTWHGMANAELLLAVKSNGNVSLLDGPLTTLYRPTPTLRRPCSELKQHR